MYGYGFFPFNRTGSNNTTEEVCEMVGEDMNESAPSTGSGGRGPRCSSRSPRSGESSCDYLESPSTRCRSPSLLWEKLPELSRREKEDDAHRMLARVGRRQLVSEGGSPPTGLLLHLVLVLSHPSHRLRLRFRLPPRQKGIRSYLLCHPPLHRCC